MNAHLWLCSLLLLSARCGGCAPSCRRRA